MSTSPASPLPGQSTTGSRPISFVLGLISGVLAGPLYFGSLVPGYLVGRTGAGSRGFWAVAGGFLVGITILMVLMISSMVNNGCPSCVDAVIVAPMAVALFIPPLAVGFWLGARSFRRDAARSTVG